MYNVTNPGEYALQHKNDDKLTYTYITEENRSELANGIVLKLSDSAVSLFLLYSDLIHPSISAVFYFILLFK